MVTPSSKSERIECVTLWKAGWRSRFGDTTSSCAVCRDPTGVDCKHTEQTQYALAQVGDIAWRAGDTVNCYNDYNQFCYGSTYSGWIKAKHPREVLIIKQRRTRTKKYSRQLIMDVEMGGNEELQVSNGNDNQRNWTGVDGCPPSLFPSSCRRLGADNLETHLFTHYSIQELIFKCYKSTTATRKT